MRPESTSVTFRSDIAAQVQEYDATKASARFIARRIAPVFKSGVCDGQYPIMNRENFKKPVSSTSRASNGSYNRITGQFGRGTFSCEENGLEYPVDDRMAKKYGNLFNAETAAGKILWYQIMMGLEQRIAALVSGAGLTNHNVTTAWSTSATAVPLTDIQTGVDTLMDACGADPSEISLVIPRADFREMMACTTIKERIIYSYPGIVPSQLTPIQVAALLGIKEVLIASNVYDATEEGYAESNTAIWTAGVCYLAVTAGENDPLEMPSAFRTIQWTEDSPEIPVVESYREESARSNILRVRMDSDEVQIAEADLMAYKLTNT